jgi:DNA-binding CsgD family transcriptional regulator
MTPQKPLFSAWSFLTTNKKIYSPSLCAPCLAPTEEQHKLIESGLSQRQTAKLIGVSEFTIRHDLRGNIAKSAIKSRTGTSPATKARRATYVVWRDGVVVPSRKMGGPKDGKSKRRINSGKSALPDGDPGDVIAHSDQEVP